MGLLIGRIAGAVLALVFIAPIVSLGVEAFGGSTDLWPHLVAYVLPSAVVNTLTLLVGVGLLVAVTGTATAWLVVAYDFPGRRILEIALLLPLALPAYLVAFAFLDLLHPIGPVQNGLRTMLGIANPRLALLPDIRSMPGCILLLGLVLYPYVYVPTRALFLTQAGILIDAGRVLSAGPWCIFLRVALPLARPAIALGTALALMEVLNDVGAAEFLGVRTLTVQVYATWVNRSDLAGAAQIALVLLAIVLVLIFCERLLRGGRRYSGPARKDVKLTPSRLPGWRGFAAMFFVAIPPTLGFAAPVLAILRSAIDSVGRNGWPESLPAEVASTAFYAAAATLIVGIVALLVCQAPAAFGGAGRALVALTRIGYALPGTILVIGLLSSLAFIDGALSATTRVFFGAAPAILALGTGSALILVFCIRFLTVAVGATEAGLARIPSTVSDAARTLGRSRPRAILRVDAPLAWPAIASGALLVFVDCVKELPVTLLLRPLNVETLSTHLYGEAVRGTHENGAVAALLIVAIGLVPILLLLPSHAFRVRKQASDQSSLSGVIGNSRMRLPVAL